MHELGQYYKGNAHSDCESVASHMSIAGLVNWLSEMTRAPFNLRNLYTHTATMRDTSTTRPISPRGNSCCIRWTQLSQLSEMTGFVEKQRTFVLLDHLWCWRRRRRSTRFFFRESKHNTSLNISYSTFHTCVSTPGDVPLSVCESSAVWCEDENQEELVSTPEVSFKVSSVLFYCANADSWHSVLAVILCCWCLYFMTLNNW